jgi:hypoxanthine phosphoribosyltransferase
MMIKRRYVTNDDVMALLGNIVREATINDFKPAAIVAPARGGLGLGTMLSHYYDAPLYPINVSLRNTKIVDRISIEQAFREAWKIGSVLVIDDINDTGATIDAIQQSIDSLPLRGDVRFGVLFEKVSSQIEADFVGQQIYEEQQQEWVVFPWEDWWNLPKNKAENP